MTAGTRERGGSGSDATSGATPGVGEYLSQQRRLRGISVDELCEATKIPRRNLERLEAGAFDDSPDGFARGFVRTVATALGLDPDEAVMRLMREPPADPHPTSAPAAGLALRIAAVALVAVVVLLLWRFASEWLASGSRLAEEPRVLYRPDVVGELARERQLVLPAEPRPQRATKPESAP